MVTLAKGKSSENTPTIYLWISLLNITFASVVHPCDKAESPCKNGAVCEKIEKQFVCKCTEGWKGETCEEKGK